jgi:hypothetical protein
MRRAISAACSLDHSHSGSCWRANPGESRWRCRTIPEVFEVLRQSGERIIIDGRCLSACTLVLSSIPRGGIYVTPKAVFGFPVDHQNQATIFRGEPPLLTPRLPRSCRNARTHRVLLPADGLHDVAIISFPGLM